MSDQTATQASTTGRDIAWGKPSRVDMARLFMDALNGASKKPRFSVQEFDLDLENANQMPELAFRANLAKRLTAEVKLTVDMRRDASDDLYESSGSIWVMVSLLGDRSHGSCADGLCSLIAHTQKHDCDVALGRIAERSIKELFDYYQSLMVAMGISDREALRSAEYLFGIEDEG